MEKDFIIYEVNKSNILKMCLLMFLFGIVGTLFLFFPTFFVSSIYRNILIIKLIGILGVITSVIFLIGHITLFGSSYGFKILKEDMLKKLSDRNATFNQYIKQNIQQMIVSFREDKTMQENIDKYARQYVYKMVLKNSNEVGKIITNTVQKWDGTELSEKMELEVGKDLQYIRINGTLVGGLVGLLIYTLTHLFL